MSYEVKIYPKKAVGGSPTAQCIDEKLKRKTV